MEENHLNMHDNCKNVPKLSHTSDDFMKVNLFISLIQ